MTTIAQQETPIWSNDNVKKLMASLEDALNKMDADYIQHGHDKPHRELLNHLRGLETDLKPVVVETVVPAHCKLCNKTFIHSGLGKALNAQEQSAAVSSHVMNVHKINDHKERKQHIQKSVISRVTYRNRDDFNRGIVKSQTKSLA